MHLPRVRVLRYDVIPGSGVCKYVKHSLVVCRSSALMRCSKFARLVLGDALWARGWGDDGDNATAEGEEVTGGSGGGRAEDDDDDCPCCC